MEETATEPCTEFVTRAGRSAFSLVAWLPGVRAGAVYNTGEVSYSCQHACLLRMTLINEV